MTVRCPKCRKKQDEPSPKRCGCGQSLLGVLADRRSVQASPSPERWQVGDNAWGIPAWTRSASPAFEAPLDPTDNDW